MSQDPSQLLLQHHLKALKLPTLLRDYASVAAVCGQERSSYLRRLEHEERMEKAEKNRLRERRANILSELRDIDSRL